MLLGVHWPCSRGRLGARSEHLRFKFHGVVFCRRQWSSCYFVVCVSVLSPSHKSITDRCPSDIGGAAGRIGASTAPHGRGAAGTFGQKDGVMKTRSNKPLHATPDGAVSSASAGEIRCSGVREFYRSATMVGPAIKIKDHIHEALSS